MEGNRSRRSLAAVVMASLWLLVPGSASGAEQRPEPAEGAGTEEGFVDEVQEEREEHVEDAANAMEKRNAERKRPEEAPATPWR